jgi:hypothetical protein
MSCREACTKSNRPVPQLLWKCTRRAIEPCQDSSVRACPSRPKAIGIHRLGIIKSSPPSPLIPTSSPPHPHLIPTYPHLIRTKLSEIGGTVFGSESDRTVVGESGPWTHGGASSDSMRSASTKPPLSDPARRQANPLAPHKQW